jgi:hypothetical protein
MALAVNSKLATATETAEGMLEVSEGMGWSEGKREAWSQEHGATQKWCELNTAR